MRRPAAPSRPAHQFAGGRQGLRLRQEAHQRGLCVGKCCLVEAVGAAVARMVLSCFSTVVFTPPAVRVSVTVAWRARTEKARVRGAHSPDRRAPRPRAGCPADSRSRGLGDGPRVVVVREAARIVVNAVRDRILERLVLPDVLRSGGAMHVLTWVGVVVDRGLSRRAGRCVVEEDRVPELVLVDVARPIGVRGVGDDGEVGLREPVVQGETPAPARSCTCPVTTSVSSYCQMTITASKPDDLSGAVSQGDGHQPRPLGSRAGSAVVRGSAPSR